MLRAIPPLINKFDPTMEYGIQSCLIHRMGTPILPGKRDNFGGDSDFPHFP